MSEEESVDEAVGQILTGKSVPLTVTNIGPIIRNFRRMAPETHVEMSNQIHASVDVMRYMERGTGRYYVSLPILFRYLRHLGLTIRIEKRTFDNE